MVKRFRLPASLMRTGGGRRGCHGTGRNQGRSSVAPPRGGSGANEPHAAVTVTDWRLPTRFVRKYTVTTQLESSGAAEPDFGGLAAWSISRRSAARKAGIANQPGGGRPSGSETGTVLSGTNARSGRTEWRQRVCCGLGLTLCARSAPAHSARGHKEWPRPTDERSASRGGATVAR